MAIDFRKPSAQMCFSDRLAIQQRLSSGPQMTKAQKDRQRSRAGARGGRYVVNFSTKTGRRYKKYL